MSPLPILMVLQLLSPQDWADTDWNAESMVVSWYNQGTKTASGERFDPAKMTAAHRDWDFGTKLLLINPDNGASVVVRINDRGPFVRGRDLDISKGAAQKLGFTEKGVGEMLAFVLPPDRGPLADLPIPASRDS